MDVHLDYIPVGTQCNNNVIIMAKQRFDVIMTFLLHLVSVGIWLAWWSCQKMGYIFNQVWVWYICFTDLQYWTRKHGTAVGKCLLIKTKLVDMKMTVGKSLILFFIPLGTFFFFFLNIFRCEYIWSKSVMWSFNILIQEWLTGPNTKYM